MANDEHLQILMTAISSGDWSKWSQWRKANPNLTPDLKSVNLQNTDLRCVDLNRADLKYAQLQRADLSGANLSGADLRFAELRGTNFTNARLADAKVEPAALHRALNARLDATEPNGGGRKFRRSGGRQASPTEVPRRIRELFRACGNRIIKLAPRLFEHEEVVTLGLSQQKSSPKDPHAGGDLPSHPPAKPDEHRK